MIQNDKYLKESIDILNRKFGEPLPTLEDTMNAHKLKKEVVYEGKLTGIKGQYLIFEDQSVFNIRSNEGKVVEISIN